MQSGFQIYQADKYLKFLDFKFTVKILFAHGPMWSTIEQITQSLNHMYLRKGNAAHIQMRPTRQLYAVRTMLHQAIFDSTVIILRF